MNDRIFKLASRPAIIACGSASGKKEWDGALGGVFDCHSDDDKFGMPTWEQAEGESQRLALNHALAKAGRAEKDIDILFAGDLINQCTSSAYGLLDFDIPFLGLYGACSTLAEGLLFAACFTDAGLVTTAAAVTSSHNCAAERQFRFPLEYGGQRTPTSQWTVTGAGAFIVANRNELDFRPELGGEKPSVFRHIAIDEVMPGRTLDGGIKDGNNMGAAMAPAAADTILRYLRLSGTSPSDYDLIVTGDLGIEGNRLAAELLSAKRITPGRGFTDCGLLIYDIERQDMHAGGSGCGCSALVMAAEILPKIESGTYKNVLFIGTGALMSPMSVQQGLPIPAVAHLVRLTHI